MDVELIQVNPRLGATAMLNGDIDFTTTFGSTLRGILSGFPMKFVAVSVRKSEHFLVARPEFKELKDLKGKRLAVSTLFGTDQRAAEEILRAKGFPIDLSSRMALGDAPIRTQALRTEHRRVRLGLFAVRSDSQSRRLSRSGRAAGHRIRVCRLRASPWPTVCCSRTRSMVKRTVRAMMKAHRYVFENKKEVVPLMTRYLLQTPDVAERSYDLLVMSLSKNGEITDQEWDILTEKKKSADEVRDFSLLREVQKELKQK